MILMLMMMLSKRIRTSWHPPWEVVIPVDAARRGVGKLPGVLSPPPEVALFLSAVNAFCEVVTGSVESVRRLEFLPGGQEFGRSGSFCQEVRRFY